MQLDVHFLPTVTTPYDVADRTVVVIDVLRATTTIIWALAAGAREVIPCLEVEHAFAIPLLRGDGVLGGERGGKPIPGFTVGNSPAEYTPQLVSGKTVIFTTTNGTRAMEVCREAKRVLIGAFVNLSRIATELQHCDRAALLCAGTNGRITREDVLFAGGVIGTLRSRAAAIERMNDEAEIAVAAWESTVGNSLDRQRLETALRSSRGGRNLIELGYDSDIHLASQIDSHAVLAELNLHAWRITLSNP